MTGDALLFAELQRDLPCSQPDASTQIPWASHHVLDGQSTTCLRCSDRWMKNGLWFFMATKLADDVDPATIDPHRSYSPRHRLEATSPSRSSGPILGSRTDLSPTAISKGRHFSCRRCVSPASAIRWIWHEHGDRRCSRSGLENGCPAGRDGVAMRLLASYELERRQVHLRTIDEAVSNFGATANQLVRPALRNQALSVRRPGARSPTSFLPPKFANSKPWASCWARATRTHRSSSRTAACRRKITSCSTCLRHIPAVWRHIFGSADGSSLYDHFGNGFTLLLDRGDRREAPSLESGRVKD